MIYYIIGSSSGLLLVLCLIMWRKIKLLGKMVITSGDWIEYLDALLISHFENEIKIMVAIYKELSRISALVEPEEVGDSCDSEGQEEQ